MFSRALWLKHSKQSRLALILLYLVYFIIVPFSYYNNSEDINNALLTHSENPYLYISDFSMLAFISPILVIILSILLIGIERNTGGIDFQFSLPYTPKQLYLSKWFFGIVHILISTLGLLVLTLIIHYSTILHKYIDASGFAPIFITLTLFTIAFFTIGLTIGTITGHYFSQTLFTIFTIFSPILIYFSVYSNLKGIFNFELSYNTFEKRITEWSIPYQAGPLSISKDFAQKVVNYPSLDYGNLLVIVIYLIIFLAIGLFCYSRNANANNGKLFVYKKFGIFVNILFVYLSATLIALLTSTIANGTNPIIYIIGLVIGTIAGYYFYKRLNKFFE
ncbi:ABC transporter permease subunit [Bacillus sp. EAC]|uniref:ABC transporter permease subunit n=1 Tax=Bacillus sp. EAC TaxID=1978338 RepID=UPI0015C50B96|nr:ABC transporter permease subunit [Bacillus sp. EAC]